MPIGAAPEGPSFTEDDFNTPGSVTQRVGTSYGAMATGLTSFLMRGAEYGMRKTGLDNPDMLKPEEIKEKYGFTADGPMSELSAAGVKAHRDALDQEAAAYRGASTVGTLGPQLVAGLADPTNFAIGFMPQLGLTTKAATAMGGSALARFSARAVIGSGEAAVVNIPGIALHQQIEKASGIPYGRQDFMRDLGMSYAMGAIIHPLVGAYGDRVKALDNMPADTKADALQSTLGSALRDEPINPSATLEQGVLKRGVDLASPETTKRLWDAPNEQAFHSILNEAGISDLPAAAAARVTKFMEVRGKMNDAQATAASFQSALDGVHNEMLRPLTDAERFGMVDAPTGDRIASIDNELEGNIPAARRAALMQERSMLTEGGGVKESEIGEAVRQRQSSLEDQQNALIGQLEQQNRKSIRYQDEAQRRMDKFVNGLQAMREEGSIRGTSQAQVQQFKKMSDDAAKDIKENPQVDMNHLKEVNAGLEQRLGDDFKNSPEFQELQDMKEAAEWHEKATTAAAICLGRP